MIGRISRREFLERFKQRRSQPIRQEQITTSTEEVPPNLQITAPMLSRNECSFDFIPVAEPFSTTKFNLNGFIIGFLVCKNMPISLPSNSLITVEGNGFSINDPYYVKETGSDLEINDVVKILGCNIKINDTNYMFHSIGNLSMKNMFIHSKLAIPEANIHIWLDMLRKNILDDSSANIIRTIITGTNSSKIPNLIWMCYTK